MSNSEHPCLTSGFINIFLLFQLLFGFCDTDFELLLPQQMLGRLGDSIPSFLQWVSHYKDTIVTSLISCFAAVGSGAHMIIV
jgi:hypothetical protein